MLQSRNMITYAAGKIIPALSTLLIMWMGIRWLGTEGYGHYILILNAVTLITSFTAGWLQQGILRYSGVGIHHPLKVGDKQFYSLLFISNCVAAAAMVLASLLYFKLDLTSVIAALCLSFLFNTYLIQLARIQSQQNSVRFAISETVAAAAGIVSIISVRYFFGTSTTLLFLGGMAFGYGTSVIYNLGTKKSEPSSTPTFQLAKGLFRFGAPLTVWLFISSLFNIADRFMIQHFYGYGAVGTYSAVYDLIYKISAFLSMPVLLSYHPSITSSWNNSEKNTTAKLIRTAVLLECLVLIGLILLFLVGSDWLFKLLMRGEHLPTGNWFYALLLSSMVWQISLLLHKPLELRMQLDKMLIGILISLLLNLLLNYLLLPAYGYTAAAWTTLACTLFYACWVIVIDKLNAKK